MDLCAIIFFCLCLLFLGYRFYGRRLSRVLRLDDSRPTPAVTVNDGVDYVPSNRFYLLGQHLSAIAAAAPIVGPVLAGLWFGWLPALAWIILGSIFIGGTHDLAAMTASIRHEGKSIAEVIRAHTSPRAYVIFLVFLWLSVVYIVTAFTDITAGTFVDEQMGSNVASSSSLYLLTAMFLGLFLRRVRLPLWAVTAVSVPLVMACIWLGRFMPISLPTQGLDPRTAWDILLLAYCFFASVIPVWFLLQPRGYLGGFFLSFTTAAALAGIIIGGMKGSFTIAYPAFTGWLNPQGLPLLPILFTTIACGACSGFHAIVSSGTSSKQIARESDARVVGYGGMLLEGLVALIALATVMMLPPMGATTLKNPELIYANGIAEFFSNLGITRDFALNFALLAFATFVYDTLDVATRLGRYIFQELCGLKGRAAPYIATAATLLLPALLVTRRMTDASGAEIPAWKAFWNVFGSSNQLLAALTLAGAGVWMYRSRMRSVYLFAPSLFMLAVSVTSLLITVNDWAAGVAKGSRSLLDPMALTCVLLLGLAAMMLAETAAVLRKKRTAGEETLSA